MFSSFFLLRETCQIIKVPVMLISSLLYSEDYDKLSFGNRQLYLTQRHMETNVCGKQTIVFNGKAWRKMDRATGYYVVRSKAVPEVLLKVVEAKRLIETEKVRSVQEAVDAVGISRSSFYKYKEDIFHSMRIHREAPLP